MNNDQHAFYMRQALALARRGRYSVSPNPMAGCIIVDNNQQIIGSGFHRKAGQPHAEIYALQQAGEQAKGATLVVTLEPCVHHGKTPPCTDAIIQAGIKNVIVACLDPNPLVNSKGIERLRAAGITVKTGICEKEAEQLNEIFFHYLSCKRPFVICKWGMSLDGKKITTPQDKIQITGSESQLQCHDIRACVDAILAGSNTICDDDPLLTARYVSDDQSIAKQPVRIILSNSGMIPSSAKIFHSDLPGKTVIATTRPDNHAHLPSHIERMILKKDSDGKVKLSSLLEELGKREITSLLVEGGDQVHHQFFSENLVNKIHVWLAPKIIASLPRKISFSDVQINQADKDFHFEINCEDFTCSVE